MSRALEGRQQQPAPGTRSEIERFAIRR
jgi:hypothetical protein